MFLMHAHGQRGVHIGLWFRTLHQRILSNPQRQRTLDNNYAVCQRKIVERALKDSLNAYLTDSNAVVVHNNEDVIS